MRAVRRLAIACLAGAVFLETGPGMTDTRPAPGSIAVVVGKDSAVKAVTVDELRELYLRRQRLWPNGTRALPINLPADNPVRDRFSRLVLGRAPQDLVSYWNARYFEGITPPTVLTSPAAVSAYVARDPTAIGYLPLADVSDRCRVLLTLP